MALDRVWITYGSAFHLRLSTALAGALLFAVVTVVRRRPGLAFLAVAGWLFGFELVDNLAGIVLYHWPLNPQWDTALFFMAGWVVAAELAGIRPPAWALAAFGGAMAGWLLTGYASNVPAGRPWSTAGEVQNVIAKTMLAIAYGAGALRSRRQRPRVVTRSRVRGQRGRLVKLGPERPAA